MRRQLEPRLPEDRLTIIMPYVSQNDLDRSMLEIGDERDENVFRHGFGGVGSHQSPPRVRRAIFFCAGYFRREFSYDFVQYSISLDGEDERDRAYLWTDHTYDTNKGRRTIGACCFRWRKWKDAPAGYALQWVWFHPFRRRQGLLSKAWPYFKSRFGDFFVEPPVSPAMQAFVSKMAAGGAEAPRS